MPYDDSEHEVYAGTPVECYRIAHGGTVWAFTSADREITIPAGTFTPAVITRSSQDFNGEDAGGDIEITLQRDSPIAALFIPYIPHSPMYVTIWRLHRGLESEAIAIFVGRVTGCRFGESSATLTCAPITQALVRRFPFLAYQTQCNWRLYSPECGVDPSAFRVDVTVTTVTGAQVVSADFDALADGWFNGGHLLRANGTRRFIVSHVGDTVTLMSPFEDLASLEVVQAYPGCQRTEAECAAKFANLDRHLGFARIPSRNPHESGVA